MDKKEILVVDDEKDIVLMLKKRLTAEGYSVITAKNGTDALQLARSKCPDLIMLDLVMPGIDGGTVAQTLKEHPATENIPVIFMTALLSRNEEYKEDHVIAGNITYAKPIDSAELLARIKKLLYPVPLQPQIRQ